jgi:type I restriction enzyme S subunit
MSFTADIDQVVAENRNRLLGTHPAWERVRLKEVAIILNGYPFESVRFSKAKGTPLIRIRDIVPGKTETFYQGEFDRAFLVQPGELLVGMDGDFNCAVWTGEPALLNQRTCKITANESRYSAQFLRYVLPGYLAAINSHTPSVTVKHLSSRTIADIPLPLPPLPEQRRIVAEIEKQFTRLEAGVAALRRVQANLKRYRAAVLKAACEGRLVPTEAELSRTADNADSTDKKSRKSASSAQSAVKTPAYETGEALLARILTERRQNWQGRGKYKEPAAPDTASLPPLSEGWTWSSLEQIARSSSYGTSAKCSPDKSGPPVLRIPNIAGGRIDLADLKFAATDETIGAGDELAPGDLLIIRTNGSKNLIGRSAVVRAKLGRATSYASYLIRFRLFGSPALFDWVGTIWDVSFLRAWIEQRAATSAGQHNISMSVLSTMPIPLPPLAEQTRIVAEVERRLSVVEELEAVVSANLQRATRLRQSILQKAFTGRLLTADSADNTDKK